MDINQQESRRHFLKKTAVLAGILAASGSVLAACGDTATAVPNTPAAVTTSIVPATITAATTTVPVTTTAATTTVPATTKAARTNATPTKVASSGNNTPAAASDPNFADVGAVTDFEDSQPKAITLNSPKQGTQENGFVVKTGSQFAALSDICTHQGCEVDWIAAAKQFECPCHGSMYDVQGNVNSGPAPRPLNHFQTKVVNGRVLVSYKSVKTES